MVNPKPGPGARTIAHFEPIERRLDLQAVSLSVAMPMLVEQLRDVAEHIKPLGCIELDFEVDGETASLHFRAMR